MEFIEGTVNQYSITKQGNVVNNKTGRTLTWFWTGIKGKQYAHVDLNGKRYAVHRLVAQAFIPNPMGLPDVNHKDCNSSNNDVSNLEWCTHRENIMHAMAHGKLKFFSGEQHGSHKLSTLQVNAIRTDRANGYTLKRLSNKYGSCISNISYIVNLTTRING